MTDDHAIVNINAHVLDSASGPEPAASPASNLPIWDLAIASPTQEKGKGKPCSGARLSQEPGDLHVDSHPYTPLRLYQHHSATIETADTTLRENLFSLPCCQTPA